MNKNRKPIYGVGINDWNTPVYIKNKQIKEYQVWTGILSRCFSSKEKLRKPCYLKSSCSDDWLLFSNFVNDLRGMVGFDKLLNENWQIDKDLLIKGNKKYSKETCCLIPKELNIFIANGVGNRGILPLGVHERVNENIKNRYVSTMFHKGKHIHLGYFNNPIDAHIAYARKKKIVLREYAEMLKGEISKDAYTALINYKICLTD